MGEEEEEDEQTRMLLKLRWLALCLVGQGGLLARWRCPQGDPKLIEVSARGGPRIVFAVRGFLQHTYCSLCSISHRCELLSGEQSNAEIMKVGS